MIIAVQALIFFREALLTMLDGLLRPYYRHFFAFNRQASVSEDEESEDQVFAEYDDEKGVVFYPPVYAQRYAAVSDCLMDDRWCGKIEKVVDLGFHDMSFIKYIKEMPGVKTILGVDIESFPLRCSSDLLGGDEYAPKRESPLQVTLFQGNAADPDYRLIGCDAVIAIEMIEHMLPHDLERLVHNVFGFIRPWIAVFTTPNSDFNVLFKSLEKNGLRRLDHFYEWSREQFHDWCSNIVARYPQYTVICKGIGPGPPDTVQYGCCSQLALFVSKEYQKQQDLNLNSLALVATNTPRVDSFSDMIGSLEDLDYLTEANMICPPNNLESYTDICSEKQSFMTIVISPSFPLDCLEYHDKMCQCNLDSEVGKNFLMFDEDSWFKVVVPRRMVSNRVYEIEDVTRRLNCTSLQVRKFSKTTQNLMAKNKTDSIVHTREVVDEIRHLTRMLNFNKDTTNRPQGGLWNNINWGENAPYWNQYFKVIKEYSYPFEKKTEEARILDLISDEINRLADMQIDNESATETSQLEIPLGHLMNVVQGITDDLDRVKDLLEWNGYEVVQDVVIHSRLVIDNESVMTNDEEWQNNEMYSEFDATDAHSTSVSDASTVVPDYHGHCLRRALDSKVRKLRMMLIGDEDISSELDKVVCRLMKLALKATRGRQGPPPTRWMLCKLFDLLTLTEKAIERRRKHFIENYTLKTLDYDFHEHKIDDILSLAMINDDKVNKLVHKYRHIVQSYENKNVKEKLGDSDFITFDLADDLNNTSNDLLKDLLCERSHLVNHVADREDCIFNVIANKEERLQRIHAWVDDDVEIVPYPNHDINISISNIAELKYNKRHSLREQVPFSIYVNKLDAKLRNKGDKVHHKMKIVNKYKSGKSKLTKVLPKKKHRYSVLLKSRNKMKPIENIKINERDGIGEIQNFTHKMVTKPIPECLIELCTPELKIKTIVDKTQAEEDHLLTEEDMYIAATKESQFVDIIMDGMEETIALLRTIGTDADDDSLEFDQETVLDSFINVLRDDSFCNEHEIVTGNVSQTIFLYDINAPSTSKGAQHFSMDVQCGPDATSNAFPMSTTTSFTKIPNFFASTEVKTQNSFTNIRTQKSTDFGTCTDDCNGNYKTMTGRIRSIGIRIKDSDHIMNDQIECCTMTVTQNNTDQVIPIVTMSKPISSGSRIDDTSFEFHESVAFFKAASEFANSSKNTSDIQIKTSVSKEVGVEHKLSLTKYVRPKLSRGGIHVHSYKEKQESEDVFFQGQWQRNRPKVLSGRRVLYNSDAMKKVYEASKRTKVNSKAKIQPKEFEKNDMKLEQRKPIQKPVQVRKTGLNKMKDGVNTQKANLAKSVKYCRNDTKIASKTAIRTSYSQKKSTSTVVKKDLESLQKEIKKTYIPVYLRKNKLKLNTVNKKIALKRSLELNKIINVNKEKLMEQVAPLVRSNTEDSRIKTALLEFTNEPRESVSYVVFRNEIENINNSVDCESSASTKENVKEKNRATKKSCNALLENNSVLTRNDSLSNRPQNSQPHSSSTPVNNDSGTRKQFSPQSRTKKSSTSVIKNNVTERPQSPQKELLPIKKDYTTKKPHSPQSQNSSSCSSTASIATVRAGSSRSKISSKRNLVSSKSNTDSGNISPMRIKKYTKKSKTFKKTNGKEFDNKENILEPFTKNNITKKEFDRMSKGVFIKANESVYMAQVATESGVIQEALQGLSRHKSQTPIKANITISNLDDKRIESPTFSARTTSKSLSMSPDRMSLKRFTLNSSQVQPIKTSTEALDTENCKENNLMEHSSTIDLQGSSCNIVLAMRQIIDEKLDFIEDKSDYISTDSEAVAVNRGDLINCSINENCSLTSFRTIVTNEEINSSFTSYLEDALNCTFESLLSEGQAIDASDVESLILDSALLSAKSTLKLAEDLNVTDAEISDIDLHSIKSTTTPASEQSEYFLADNELSNIQTLGLTESSVRDIFERKEQLKLQVVGGVLGSQTVSVFSVSTGLRCGDRSDPVNLVDSETGSMAVEVARLVTSEELLTSGRSSGSYASCFVEEDAVVPYWLFNSSQQSVDEEETDESTIPLPEPIYDANGNVSVAAGTGAGAGDGRGIHSDRSQDSSGRGTSLSSSDSSSGVHSEVASNEGSAYAAQFELIRETVDDSIASASPAVAVNSPGTPETVEVSEMTSTLRDWRRNPVVLQHVPSDDADVSSLDTDLQDSSDV